MFIKYIIVDKKEIYASNSYLKALGWPKTDGKYIAFPVAILFLQQSPRVYSPLNDAA